MRVIFTGSRDGYEDERTMDACFRILMNDRNLVVIHGAAKGVDTQVDLIANRYSVDVEAYPADWNTHHPDWCPGYWCTKRRYCVGAGPRRNQQMLDLGADMVIAFKKGFDQTLKKGGTEDMIRRAREAGIETAVYD